jgi:hypothetical protein
MKAFVQLDWKNTPHIDPVEAAQILASIPPWQRTMRTTGIPSFGVGAIYPVPEADFVVSNFDIPDHWKRGYGFDVGWHVNAAVFAAYDSASDVIYIVDEIYKGRTEPSTIANAIKSRGAWQPGVIDPAAAGSGQKDGKKLIEVYRDELGLDLEPADNAVITGLTLVWERLSQGRLKIFQSCVKLLGEMRLYRRNEKGVIVETPDHALDALRYFCMSGLERAKVEPKNVGKEAWRSWRHSAVWAG